MIAAGKVVDPGIMIGFNARGYPPPNADLALHFSEMVSLVTRASNGGLSISGRNINDLWAGTGSPEC
jgi:hypothetical protein